MSLSLVLYFTIVGPELDAGRKRDRRHTAYTRSWRLFWPLLFLSFSFVVLSARAWGFAPQVGVILTYAALSPPTAYALVRLWEGFSAPPRRPHP